MEISLAEAVKKIKNVEVQGATEIAIFALKFLLEYSKKYGFGKKFDNALKGLEKARPTGVVLHNALKIVRQQKSEATIRFLINDIKNSRGYKIASNVDKILRKIGVIKQEENNSKNDKGKNNQ